MDMDRIAGLVDELEDAHDEMLIWHDPHDMPGLRDNRYDEADTRFRAALQQLRELTTDRPR